MVSRRCMEQAPDFLRHSGSMCKRRSAKWTPWLPCEKIAEGEDRTEVKEATEGGMGLVAKSCSVNTVAPAQENSRLGEASHRGHRGHRGGTGSVAKSCSVNTVAPARKVVDGEKHRTEVTEATEGEPGRWLKIAQ